MKIDTNALIMAQVLGGGGGSSVTVEPLVATANGKYTAPTGKAYSPVTVNVAKPDYLISDGDSVSTFYFNTAYALGTWLATLTYSDLDPGTGLYVCYTGLGYFFGVDLTSGQYALVWNDGVNIVPIYSTVAVPSFGVTEAGWQMASYAPSVATTVVVSQIIPELSEVIDEVVAEDSIAFGSSAFVPVIGVYRNIKTSNTDGPSGSYTMSDAVSFKAKDVIRAYAVQKRTTIAGQTPNVAPYTSDSGAVSLSAADLNFTAGSEDWMSNISYTFTNSSTLTNQTYNTYVLVILFKAPDEFKARLNSDGTFDFIQTRDADHLYTLFTADQGVTSHEFVPDVQVFKRAIFESGVTTTFIWELYGRSFDEIVFPSSLTTIGGQTFRYCRNLKSVTIPSTITSIGQYAFRESGITSLTIESASTALDTYCFSYCKNLSEVNLPNGLEAIPNGTFSSSKSLKQITFPQSLKTIGGYAFQASGLTSIDLPSGVTSIGAQTFQCPDLTSITCRATTPPSLDSLAFNNVPASCPIYVPAASVSAYKTAANWSDRASYIQAIPS